MNLPFDAWLIVVGLALGAGLAWLVLADMRRRDDDVSASEMRSEAAWLADTLRQQGIAADADAVEEVLRLHRAYLAGIPDDASWALSASATDELEPLPEDPPLDAADRPGREPASPPPDEAAPPPAPPPAPPLAASPAGRPADVSDPDA